MDRPLLRIVVQWKNFKKNGSNINMEHRSLVHFWIEIFLNLGNNYGALIPLYIVVPE